MKILYLPIFETASVHQTAFDNKRGLYTALAKAGHSVVEVDYQAWRGTGLGSKVMYLIEWFQPDLMLTQLHGADVFLPHEIRMFRAACPTMKIANWSGDSWAHGLTAQPILDMAREFDIQLVAAPDVLPVYAEHGIRAAFWNIGYEPPVRPLPDMPHYDVVWLANVINDKRRTLMERLKALKGIRVGIYGDWEHADGNNVYDFAAGEALYKNATLAIADNVYADTQHYISNRPMQVMAAGGALLLHQHVPRMADISDGWQDGVHYVDWANADDLIEKIGYWLSPERDADREWIVGDAYQHVMEHHTYEARVKQLMEML